MRVARSLTRSLTRVLLEQQTGARCLYCGTHTPAPTFDHYIPISKGGSRAITNVVPACRPCNQLKDNRDPEEFIARDCAPGTRARVQAFLADRRFGGPVDEALSRPVPMRKHQQVRH